MFIKDGYYHVYNRGVDKRDIFVDDKDRELFMRRVVEYSAGLGTVGSYCLMTNHFHLLICEHEESGIAKFMQKLGTSYTKLFNKRYGRTGRLFETSYKKKYVDSDGYLAHLIRYIHLNPLGKKVDSARAKEMLDQLKNYKWSDCHEYLSDKGKFNFIFDDISYKEFILQEILYPKLDFQVSF